MSTADSAIPDVSEADPDDPETWPEGLQEAVVEHVSSLEAAISEERLVATYIQFRHLWRDLPKVDIEITEADRDALLEVGSE